MLNLTINRVGGLTFIRLGRLSLSFCVTASFEDATREARKAAKRERKANLQWARIHKAASKAYWDGWRMGKVEARQDIQWEGRNHGI